MGEPSRLSEWLNSAVPRAYLSRLVEYLVRALEHLKITPNGLTLVGLLIGGVAAFLAAIGAFFTAGMVLLLAGFFDVLDGALARRTGNVTAFGALLDSFVDRVQEACLLLGLLVYYQLRGETGPVLLVYLALVSSILVSYVRARAEALGVKEIRVGYMARPQRVIIISIGLLIGQPPVALGIVAALAFFTTLQRVIHARRFMGKKQL